MFNWFGEPNAAAFKRAIFTELARYSLKSTTAAMDETPSLLNEMHNVSNNNPCHVA